MPHNTYCLLDTETTGISGKRDEIIDIAIIKIKDGKIIDQYETLVRPNARISSFIQNYTGITNDMVLDAPRFHEVADNVQEFLSDGVLVAHNVGFDFSFLRHEFERMGRLFDTPRLCTVKLSRHLYPQFPKHGLDAIIERYDIDCSARHRAMGDTEVLWEFWQLLNQEFAQEDLSKALKNIMTHPKK